MFEISDSEMQKITTLQGLAADGLSIVPQTTFTFNTSYTNSSASRTYNLTKSSPNTFVYSGPDISICRNGGTLSINDITDSLMDTTTQGRNVRVYLMEKGITIPVTSISNGASFTLHISPVMSDWEVFDNTTGQPVTISAMVIPPTTPTLPTPTPAPVPAPTITQTTGNPTIETPEGNWDVYGNVIATGKQAISAFQIMSTDPTIAWSQISLHVSMSPGLTASNWLINDDSNTAYTSAVTAVQNGDIVTFTSPVGLPIYNTFSGVQYTVYATIGGTITPTSTISTSFQNNSDFVWNNSYTVGGLPTVP